MGFSFDWITSAISTVLDIIPLLSEKSKTTNLHKKLVFRELRDNLKVFVHAFRNKVKPDKIVDNLSNDAIKNAIKDNFNFDKLRRGKIEAEDIHDDRNLKYAGWDCERLIFKIDEKIEELRTIKKLNGSLKDVQKTNITLMLTNLYFRMKLLAGFVMDEDREK